MALALDILGAHAFSEIPTGLLIGGHWRASADGRTFTVEDPATELPLAEVAAATPSDALAALAAADLAQTDWAAAAPRERGELLRRSFDALSARTEHFAQLISFEMGKPLREARGRWHTRPSSSAGSPKRRCVSAVVGQRPLMARRG